MLPVNSILDHFGLVGGGQSSLILFASGKIAFSKYDLIYTLLLGAAAIYAIRFDGFVLKAPGVHLYMKPIIESH